jgi:putative transposase
MKKDRKKSRRQELSNDVGEIRRRISLGEVVVDIRGGLRELMVQSGGQVLAALLQEDLVRLCGPRHARKNEGQASRWGKDRGELVLGGRKINVDKPRARLDDHEVELPMYVQFQNEDPLSERMLEQMLIGVSTRKYNRSLEPVPEGLTASSTSKSEVSRRFVQMTEAQVEEALAKPLDRVQWAAIMVDGISYAEHIIVVALGIDASGKKHLLGVREGSTENATLCKEMLSDLVGRGLPADRSLLVVIDGGKGIRKAVTQVFGRYALVQRCQVHKTRNVVEQLPEGKRAQVRAALAQAYGAASVESGLTQMKNLARSLKRMHPGAAASLEEGLEEMLTLNRLGVGGTLAKTLRSTNPIENLNGTLRHVSKRVKRWSSGRMALRWAVAGALEAAARFRRVKGFAQLPQLLAALRANDQLLKTPVRKAG